MKVTLSVARTAVSASHVLGGKLDSIPFSPFHLWVILVLGLVALVEMKFSPPIWIHLVLWTPFIICGAVLMLRPLKAGLIALQYRHHLLVAPPPC